MELTDKSDEYAALWATVKDYLGDGSTPRKDMGRVLGFILIIEFWLEQGDRAKASDTLKDLKKMIGLEFD